VANRVCPFCKEKVNEKAVLCKHCRSELPPLPPPPPKEWYQTWQGLLLILFVLGIIAQAFEDKPSTPKAPPKDEATIKAEKQYAADDMDARIYAKLYVEKALKAPATAKWPSSTSYYVENAKDKKGNHLKDVWEVSGYVDSQNSFGAMIRSQWYVKLKKTGTDSWKLLNIKM